MLRYTLSSALQAGCAENGSVARFSFDSQNWNRWAKAMQFEKARMLRKVWTARGNPTCDHAIVDKVY